jgi:hypothetical protein
MVQTSSTASGFKYIPRRFRNERCCGAGRHSHFSHGWHGWVTGSQFASQSSAVVLHRLRAGWAAELGLGISFTMGPVFVPVSSTSTTTGVSPTIRYTERFRKRRHGRWQKIR